MLEASLAKERDATAARRTYGALCELRHDLPDAELLELARSASVERLRSELTLESR